MGHARSGPSNISPFTAARADARQGFRRIIRQKIVGHGRKPEEIVEPQITGKYRKGDIRHCFADITRAREVLGYEPQVTMDEGLAELAQWLSGQVAHDRVERASAELAERGLTV